MNVFELSQFETNRSSILFNIFCLLVSILFLMASGRYSAATTPTPVCLSVPFECSDNIISEGAVAILANSVRITDPQY